jgi:hypothetical protein
MLTDIDTGWAALAAGFLLSAVFATAAPVAGAEAVLALAERGASVFA